MVYTKWMIENKKKLVDCKVGDVAWIISGDGFERIFILGPGPKTGYVSYCKDDGSQFYATDIMSCWSRNPDPINPRLKTLTTEDLLNIFWFFDKHGLIKEDLAFDPEHFMDTVAREQLPYFDYKNKQ